jgi:predicted AAA+ superfamily ATPase
LSKITHYNDQFKIIEDSMENINYSEYIRTQHLLISRRAQESRKFIQVIFGPRQVGKTTLIVQILRNLKGSRRSVYGIAGGMNANHPSWIHQKWEEASIIEKETGNPVVLVLDEVQKITGWDEEVKLRWDEDTRNQRNIFLILLGSSPWQIQKGLSESLTGRFETLYLPHWSLPEVKQAFHMNVDDFVFWGGYPGSLSLKNDFDRWVSYVNESIIEATLLRDIIETSAIEKPALLRKLLLLGIQYSGQIFSYTKIQGQLQDSGNTTTLAHYLDLLERTGILMGIQKYSGASHRVKKSSPKFQVFNTALISAQFNKTFQQAKENSEYWGRLVESAVGAYLANQAMEKRFELYYWNDGQREVDFVVKRGHQLFAIEVKSGRRKTPLPGIDLFLQRHPKARAIRVGHGGISIEDFLSQPFGE